MTARNLVLVAAVFDEHGREDDQDDDDENADAGADPKIQTGLVPLF
jgi:hypothetical protein